MFVESTVDGIVVTCCFDRCFRTCILSSEVAEIHVCDANLFDDITIIVQYSDVRITFMNVDPEIVHGFLWDENTWNELHLFEVVARLRQQSGLTS